jgi:hypothetical protein
MDTKQAEILAEAEKWLRGDDSASIAHAGDAKAAIAAELAGLRALVARKHEAIMKAHEALFWLDRTTILEAFMPLDVELKIGKETRLPRGWMGGEPAKPKCDHVGKGRTIRHGFVSRTTVEECAACGQVLFGHAPTVPPLWRPGEPVPPPGDLAAFAGPAAPVVREPAMVKPAFRLKRLEMLAFMSGASLNAGEALAAARADAEELLAKPLVKVAAGSAKDGPRMERLEKVLTEWRAAGRYLQEVNEAAELDAIDYAEAVARAGRP